MHALGETANSAGMSEARSAVSRIYPLSREFPCLGRWHGVKFERKDLWRQTHETLAYRALTVTPLHQACQEFNPVRGCWRLSIFDEFEDLSYLWPLYFCGFRRLQ